MRLCDTTRYEIDEIRIQDFLKLKSQIESQQEKCEIIYTRVYLFFDQPEFISLCDKINGLCSVNSIKFLGFMDRIEPLLNSASHALTIGDIPTYRSINVTIDEKSEEIDEYLDRNDPAELLDKFKTISWTLLYR